MKAMIRDAYCPTIAVRGTEAGHFREQGEPRGSDRSGGAHRIREGPPFIDRTYPLAEVPEAIRYLEEGHARGKVLITV